MPATKAPIGRTIVTQIGRDKKNHKIYIKRETETGGLYQSRLSPEK